VTALRPSADAESSGWWTFVRDPSVDLSSVRTVLGEGMWSGVAISAASAIAVAVVSALLGGRLSARLGGRAAPLALVAALAAVPAVSLAMAAHAVLDLAGLADSIAGALLVHLVLGVP